MKIIKLALLLLITQPALDQKLLLYDLTCEHKTNPMGVDVPEPRLSWKIGSSGKNIIQTAYHIRVATDKKFSPKNIMWESGKVLTNESVLQPCSYTALQSGKRYYWQVRAWDGSNKQSAWSEPAFWEMGLLKPEDWKANWIEPVQDTIRMMPGLLVRKDFFVKKKIAAARAYVTSHGLYELYLNGKKAGDELFTPGWTSYQKRLQYQVYDITGMLQEGENAIGAMLGDGWYRGSLAWPNNWGLWGKKLGLLCQLQIRYSDNSEEIIITDNTWKGTQEGPVRMNGIYYGENYDARLEMKGWANSGFDDRNWQTIHTVIYAKTNLIATQSVPVRRIQELKPVKIFKTPKGLLVADFGQNMVGWIRLKVKGVAGTQVTIRHAEVLDKYGEFYTDNLRAADAIMKYTLKGEQAGEIYEPHFSFFGFRYAAIDGYPGELNPVNFTAIVIHSDMKPTGTFECSNPLINQLQHNIQWGQKGNFLDVPTDCPQRDERLGWTGDAQAFCRTAAFNMDVAAFLTKWLKDLAADQYQNGGVPFVIPDVLRNRQTSAGWGDAATIVPWTLYQVYGDKRILETQYPSMKGYVDYIRNRAGSSFIWKRGSVFGDWLFYKSMEHTENDGYTDPDMIATMFFAYSAKLLAETAALLGKSDEEKLYIGVFENVKEAFNKNYVTPEGRIAAESQTSYVLALMFDLLPEHLRPKAAQYLVDDIKGRNTHLSTGFLGTPYLCHVLSQNGFTTVAYDLLMQESFPSWLYPVKMGATTIWERWDGQKTDSTFQDEGMNSFNHYAYGAIGDWMYRTVAGIEIGRPGYHHILIQPQPDKRLSYAKAIFESNYGQIASGWEIKDESLILRIKIPANTTATITLPYTEANKVTENGTSITTGFKNIKQDGSNVIVETGSGEYIFEYLANSAIFKK